jgi:hypothetical protein
MRNNEQLLKIKIHTAGQKQGCEWNESERPGFVPLLN